MKYSSEEIESLVRVSLKVRREMLRIAELSESETYKNGTLALYHVEMSEEEYTEMKKKSFAILPKHPFKGNWTTAEKSKILNDWLFFFPNLARRKPKAALERLVGPLWLSLSFKMRTSFTANYKVYYSIHNLTYIHDFMVAGLNSIPLDIMRFYEHEAKYKKYVEKVKTEYNIAPSCPVTLDNIFADYERGASQLYEIGVPALTAAWAGEPEKAQKYLEWGYNRITNRYNSFIDIVPSFKNQLIQVDKWHEEHQKLIANPEALRSNARAEARKFKLEFAPYQDIVGVPYQPGSLFDK